MAAAKGIGVFSDIHGNRRAFAAVIQIIKQRQDLAWLCLGDVVGWFFRPVQCVLMLKELVDNGFVAASSPAITTLWPSIYSLMTRAGLTGCLRRRFLLGCSPSVRRRKRFCDLCGAIPSRGTRGLPRLTRLSACRKTDTTRQPT